MQRILLSAFIGTYKMDIHEGLGEAFIYVYLPQRDRHSVYKTHLTEFNEPTVSPERLGTYLVPPSLRFKLKSWTQNKAIYVVRWKNVFKKFIYENGRWTNPSLFEEVKAADYDEVIMPYFPIPGFFNNINHIGSLIVPYIPDLQNTKVSALRLEGSCFDPGSVEALKKRYNVFNHRRYEQDEASHIVDDSDIIFYSNQMENPIIVCHDYSSCKKVLLCSKRHVCLITDRQDAICDKGGSDMCIRCHRTDGWCKYSFKIRWNPPHELLSMYNYVGERIYET